MTDYLVFQLYGPIAAWGDIAVGEYRPTFAHPSKSAIIGLLAAALGIRRDEEERQRSLAKACAFAVRVDAMGSLLRDYHTVQVPSARKGVSHYTRRSELHAEGLNTILSTRDYRCDAAYTVAVRIKEGGEFSAQEISERLQRPHFTLYLGRKSCTIAMPLQPKVVQATNAKEAFDNVSFAKDALPGVLPSPQVSIYWEDEVEGGFRSDHIIVRRDVLLSRARWQFADRRENYVALGKEE